LIFGDLSFGQVAGFLLVLVRAGAMLLTLPFFGSAQVPPLAKAGLALSVALVMAPVVAVPAQAVPRGTGDFLLVVGGEVLIGAILGLAVRMLMTAVQIMGQLIGFQMGFAVANVLDPVSGVQASVLAQFAFLITILAMFTVNAHHYFFRAIADSFALAPVGQLDLSRDLFQQVMNAASRMFSLAVRLGAPVIAALLFTDVIMGILAKTVPQMNILMVGFPIKITVGMFFLGLTMTLIVPMLADIFRNLGPMLAGLLKAM
jgi:flagellar biosynthetic protein FliR